MMRRIFLLLLLASSTLPLLHAQPHITSLQSAPNASGPLYGAAITTGSSLKTFTLYINGSFTPSSFSYVNWTNTTTNVAATFTPASGVVSHTATQIIVTVPYSLFGPAVSSPQTANITVVEMPSSLPVSSNTAPFTLNPPLASVAQTDLPAATVGQSYTTPIFSGGTPPYTVTLADDSSPGALPPGINFTSGTAISGIPTQAGLYRFDVQVVDEWGNYITPTDYLDVFGVPVLTAATPASAPAGSNTTTVTLTGTNFAGPSTGLSVNYAGSTVYATTGGISPTTVQLATSILSSTTATVAIPSNLLLTAQNLTLQMVQPTYSSSNALTFPVLAPTITTLAPSSITARSTAVTLTVTGANFLAGGSAAPSQSTILLNGSAVTTTFGSATSLSTSAVFSNAGTVPVQVENPGGALSSTVNLTVLPAPTITSVTPSPFPGGKLTVNGTNFTSNMTVQFNGSSLPTSFVNTGILTATVPSSIFSGTTALITIQTTDGYTTAATKINLGTALQITTTSIPAATGLQPYDAKLAATGGTPPYAWRATGLPQGLTINSSTGEITGTPTSYGNVTVSVTVFDANSLTATATYPLAISTPNPAPQINTTAPPTGFVNVSYNFTFTATGGNGNLTYALTSGSVLPPGLSLDSTGFLKGIPTTLGSYNFSVTVTDADGLSSSGTFTVVIKPQPLTITTAVPLANVSAGSPVNITFTASGGVPPYSFSYTGALPPGTNLSSGGTLSGTPTTPGTYNFAIVVNDSAQSAAGTKNFSLTVNTPSLTVTATLGNGQVGVAYTGQIGATGGVPPYTFAVTGLPDGLSYTNGAVTGTPTTVNQYTVSVTATDSANTTATQTFPVSIAAAPLTVTTSSLPNGTVNVAYSATLAASGGSGKYSWAATGLPAGISVSTAGSLSGTPTATGTFSITATVTDTAVSTAVVSASKTFSVTIAAAALSVTTASLPNATAGAAYSATLAATGGVSPYTWTATGLPAGLSLSAAGVITGTTTVTGAATVGVTVKDSAGTTATHSFQLTVTLPSTPGFNISGLPASAAPATQSTLTTGIASAYPVNVTVNLTLAFAPASGPDDPAVQFSTGGRTAQLTINAGSTTALSTVGIQTGTVAGTATITAQLLAGTTDITPSPAPSYTVRIPSVAPVVSSVTAASNSTGFTVTIIGYATSRSMTQAVFTFTPAAGVSLQSSSVTVSAASLFSTWYSSSAAAPFGSQFSFSQPFTVTGGTSAVSSVSVVLTNADGSSTPVSATVH